MDYIFFQKDEAYDFGGVKTNNKKEISALSASNMNGNSALNTSNSDMNRKVNSKETHWFVNDLNTEKLFLS